MPIRPPLAIILGLGSVVSCAMTTGPALGAEGSSRCEVRSSAHPPLLVELYTSEGCNSCPPADRWLSTLRGRQDVLAAAFHVDYWDSLGWKDRFGSPSYTQRQQEMQHGSGARFSYTPQVLVNGADWRGWPRLPEAASASPVSVRLARESEQRVVANVSADASPATGAAALLAAWWALLEDGHVSSVKAGENSGETLHHDHVVRRYGKLPPWDDGKPRAFSIDVPRTGEGGRPTRLLFVVTDARSGRPLQAVQIGC